MVDKISVQIQLEGAAEIERQLAGVSQAGQQCFADIQKAAEQAGGFAKLDPTVATAKFKQFGVTATGEINKINAALKSAANLEATVGGVSKLENGFKKVGTAATAAFGLTRREIGALKSALGAIDLGPIGSQLGLIGRIGGAFGPIGIGIVAIGVAIAGTVAAMAKFSVEAEEVEKGLTQLQAVSGQSFQNLSALSQVFAEGGTPLKQFATEIGNLSEKIADAAQQNKIRAASKDSMEWANNISSVRRQFDNLASGAQAIFSPLTTLDTKVKGVLESLAKVGADEQIFKLANIFKNLATDAERAQLGKALGLSPETIASLTLGADALRAMKQEAINLGVALDRVDQSNLVNLRSAQVQASALFDEIKIKVGALVSPAITSFWEGFTKQIRQLSPLLTQVGQQVGQLDLSSLGQDAANSILYLAEKARNLVSELKAVGGAWAAMTKDFKSSLTKQALDPFVQKIRELVTLMNELVAITATWVGQKFFGISAEQAAELRRQITGAAQAAQGAAAATSSVAEQGKAASESGQTMSAAYGETAESAQNVAQSTGEAASNAAILAQQAQMAARALAAGGRDPVTHQIGIAGYDPANFASGGLLGGRGTGTSDSNLAWVSRGEHIMPARAVAQPGVLAFLEALRRSGGNLRGIFDGMGRFAMGGMVPRSMPAFASGGLSGGNNVTIQFPGLQPIGGLRASSAVVDELRKAAALAQVRSGGRKPSRYA